jgi:hypothetical protein
MTGTSLMCTKCKPLSQQECDCAKHKSESPLESAAG